MNGSTAAGATEIRVTRVFPAPPERVFRAWTEPAHLARWWWPWSPTIEVDLRVGGAYRFAAEHPVAGGLAVAGTFRDVRAPERLVYSWAWEGDAGAGETLVTVEFREVEGGGTEVSVTHGGFASVESGERHRQGWSDCLDRLEGSLVEVALSVR